MKNLIPYCFCLLFATGSFSQTYPAGFSQSTVASGITNPTVMAFAPDGRIFVAQQNGQLRVIKNGTLLATPFLTLTVNSSGERGLIGIALDPNFANNQFIYLYYTTTEPRNKIIRVTANGDVVLAGSSVDILILDPLSSATNHNGGALAFGPDGKLYVAVGDNATGANAQNLNTYHGKILRTNPDGSAPADNPFPTGSEQRKRVWAYGLRNPYTISFQPGTGKLYVNDVGQNTWEEINDATQPGRNFGWPTAEGNSTNTAFTNPVYAYQHGSKDGQGCAITGGTFFNPSSTNYPGTYYGRYFFLDFCTRWINSINPTQTPAVRASFATTIGASPVILQVGNDGNLYYLSRGAGALYRLNYNNTSTPFITNHPSAIEVMEGDPATFTVSAVGSMPFSYQWQKDGVDIPNTTNSTFSIAEVDPDDEGMYRVRISNAAGNTTSNEAALTVIPVNDFPVAQIITPAEGSLYTAGTSISFSGTGTDAEDGGLPASAFSWQINFHHDMHVHDQPPITNLTEGTFDVPNLGETSSNVWYRIYLTVTDSEGLTAVDSVDVHPRKSTLSFATDPPGFEILLDDQPFATPGNVVSVEGMLRKIGVITPQFMDDHEYAFSAWSHGGDELQTIPTPVDNVTYTANFSIVVGTEVGQQKQMLRVYPNPSNSDWIMINVVSDKPQSAQLYLIDALSRKHEMLELDLRQGENTIRVSTINLRSGIHLLVLESNQWKRTKKILVK